MAAIHDIKNGGYQPGRAEVNFNSDFDIQTLIKHEDGIPLEPGTTAVEWSTATPPLGVAVWEFLGPEFANQWGKISTL